MRLVMVNSQESKLEYDSQGRGAVKSDIQSVEVAYFVHETEDPERMAKAVADLLGLESAPESEAMEGHFGNRIVRMKIRVAGGEAGNAARSLFASMPAEVSRDVAANLGSFVDEHSALFLRLDKQGLVQGRLALGSGDSIRIKVKPRLYQVKGGAAGFYRRLMEESRGG